ncbi:MAG: HAD-IIA family hydrolase [Alphaproteobacteria bacterium]|nr:HAD-IIA family hydrolase [Alphaproteobacteria bacterium]
MSQQASTVAREFADARWAFERYEAIRPRLPTFDKPGLAQERADLGEIADRFDAFVFDSFGVLNVGEVPIPGAAARIADLRRRGKKVLVLTNAATAPLDTLPLKYADLGFDFSAEEVISSRAILATHLKQHAAPQPWSVIAPEASNAAELEVPFTLIEGAAVPEGRAGGVILLSSQTMDDDLYVALKASLASRPGPVLVGNPDLVAPRVEGYSLEPGTYAHQLADDLGLEPEFFGKPYDNAFNAVSVHLGRTVQPHRIAMVGDTLHTDILGGSAAGFGTILVKNYGVLKSLDVTACIEQSGISPDYIVPQI